MSDEEKAKKVGALIQKQLNQESAETAKKAKSIKDVGKELKPLKGDKDLED